MHGRPLIKMRGRRKFLFDNFGSAPIHGARTLYVNSDGLLLLKVPIKRNLVPVWYFYNCIPILLNVYRTLFIVLKVEDHRFRSLQPNGPN